MLCYALNAAISMDSSARREHELLLANSKGSRDKVQEVC